MERWRKVVVVGVAVIAFLFFFPVALMEDGHYPLPVSQGCGLFTTCNTEAYGTHIMLGSIAYWAFGVGGVINGTYSVAGL